jgi:Xaa-Pro aminopeptidase
MVEKMARPGVKCATLFSAVDEHLQQKRGKGMAHHLGHGIGLQPHEFPHLNPKWDDVLMEGEVFTAEPGIYGPELGGGIRIENNYVVTKDGVRNLLNSPLELA